KPPPDAPDQVQRAEEDQHRREPVPRRGEFFRPAPRERHALAPKLRQNLRQRDQPHRDRDQQRPPTALAQRRRAQAARQPPKPPARQQNQRDGQVRGQPGHLLARDRQRQQDHDPPIANHTQERQRADPLRLVMAMAGFFGGVIRTYQAPRHAAITNHARQRLVRLRRRFKRQNLRRLGLSDERHRWVGLGRRCTVLAPLRDLFSSRDGFTRVQPPVAPELPEQPQPADPRAQRADHGEVLVDRKLRQDVIVLRLAPAPDLLLLQPVAKRADRARHQAVLIAENRGEEEREDA